MGQLEGPPGPVTGRGLLVGLFALSLVVRLLAALPLDHAGYFDAFYYFDLARNMAQGRGIVDDVVWNYLDRPQSLPRPGNLYWMPMTNLWAWAGIRLLGPLLGPWRAAQAPFVIAAAALPPLAAWIAGQAWGRRDFALQAGVLTLFSGFYFIFWGITDNFTPFALAVAWTLLALWRAQQEPRLRWWLAAGAGAALAHLSRVDGALLVPLIAVFAAAGTLRSPRRPGRFFWVGTAAATGYLLLMGPWLLRNILVAATPFPGGGTSTLWMRSYSELFAYEPLLTPARYFAWGIGPILRSKVQSLGWSVLIMLGSTQFFLAPFVLLSARRAWRQPLFRPFLAYALLLVTAMPLLFTFPATRGSLLHSSAALLPWMMALVPPGIERAVGWVAARRARWDAAEATRVLGTGFTGLAAVVTLYLYAAAVWLPPTSFSLNPRWNERTRAHIAVENRLRQERVPLAVPILVADPPVYHARTDRPALALPSEGPGVAARAAREWEAPWLMLTSDHTPPYSQMYEEGRGTDAWRLVASFEDPLGRPVRLFTLQDRP